MKELHNWYLNTSYAEKVIEAEYKSKIYNYMYI
jgi:hypothetical protein